MTARYTGAVPGCLCPTGEISTSTRSIAEADVDTSTFQLLVCPGSQLRDRCENCNEPVASLKFRFCPYCGKSYKNV